MKSRIILGSMLLAAIGIFSLSATAQQGDKQSEKKAGDTSAADSAKLRDELAIQEAMLKRQYAEFEDSVLKLAQRLKRSSKLEDRERAAVLEKVLEESSKSSILVQFEQIVDHLKKSQLTGSGDTGIALAQANKLADDLRRRVALQAGVVIGVPDEVRVPIPLEVESILRQPGHRLSPGDQRLAQRVVLRRR